MVEQPCVSSIASTLHDARCMMHAACNGILIVDCLPVDGNDCSYTVGSSFEIIEGNAWIVKSFCRVESSRYNPPIEFQGGKPAQAIQLPPKESDTF